MKLVIQTQIRENYAAHNGFDGEYYWKYKGGNTYVVENLSAAQCLRIKEEAIPTLKALITEMNDYYEEYIVDWSFEDDDAVVCESWETPIILAWVGNRWTASVTRLNDDYGYMRMEISKKLETWDLMMGGERENYKVLYEIRDTQEMVDSEALSSYIKCMEAA